VPELRSLVVLEDNFFGRRRRKFFAAVCMVCTDKKIKSNAKAKSRIIATMSLFFFFGLFGSCIMLGQVNKRIHAVYILAIF
jgi:hypothetical protein